MLNGEAIRFVNGDWLVVEVVIVIDSVVNDGGVTVAVGQYGDSELLSAT